MTTQQSQRSSERKRNEKEGTGFFGMKGGESSAVGKNGIRKRDVGEYERTTKRVLKKKKTDVSSFEFAYLRKVEVGI